jgi:hypothetical protein
MMIRRTLAVFILALLLPVRLVFSQEIIPHSVGLFLTPKGQEYLSNNVEEIFFLNGLSIDSAYFPTATIETEEQTLEDMFENQHELRELIEKIKENVSRFFIGADIDKHKFKVDIHEIEFFADWSEISMNIIKQDFNEGDTDAPDLSFQVYVEARKVQLNVAKIDINDLNHPFLGEYGIDHAELILDEHTSHPLYVSLAVHVYNRNGSVFLEVDIPQSNISEVLFRSNFRSPLRLPVIEIRINDHVVRLNQSEVEKLFREKQNEIFTMAQEEIQNWLDNEAKDLLNTKISEVITGGALVDVNQMDPPGAPEGANVPKFEWGLSLSKMGTQGDLVHLGLDGFVRDPLKKTSPNLPRHLVAQRPPSLERDHANGYDLMMSLNQGFMNKIIQLSGQRGYFNEVELDNGDKMPMTKTPELILNGGRRPSLNLEIEYRVTGAQAMFVKNPIRISFNLLIDFEVDRATGLTKLVGRGVDLDTINLPDRYIRMFAGRVRSAVRKTISDMQSDLNGMVIVDEFPIPDSLFGIPLRVRNAKIDRSGHMIIYINFNDTE